ncbi:hypothetical protein ACNOYE_23560 [Nannocystaceae bacterium ST9]
MSRLAKLSCLVSSLLLAGCDDPDPPAEGETGTSESESESGSSSSSTTGEDEGETATTSTSSDGETSSETETGSESETGGGFEACPEFAPGEGAIDGSACLASSECASKLCVRFQDAPPLAGTCEPVDPGCRMRFTGRVLDFETLEPIADADVKVAAALQAALMPASASAVAMGTSDAGGRFDFLSIDAPVSVPLYLVALISGTGDALTATKIATPINGAFYDTGNPVHDLWVVPLDLLSSYTAMLEADPEFANQLPLGETGGVVGLIREAITGDPIAGARVVSADPSSGAHVRYLDASETSFTTDASSSNGKFVLIGPGLGELFELEIDGLPVEGVATEVGSASGVIWTMVFDVP